MSEERHEGWGKVRSSEKRHYFSCGRSLCGKFHFYYGKLRKDVDGSDNNCTSCKKALKKRKEKEAVKNLEEKGKVDF